MGILTGAERTSLSGADMKLTKLPLALQDIRKTASMLTPTHTSTRQLSESIYSIGLKSTIQYIRGLLRGNKRKLAGMTEVYIQDK